jgi:hypothetical protein
MWRRLCVLVMVVSALVGGLVLAGCGQAAQPSQPTEPAQSDSVVETVPVSAPALGPYVSNPATSSDGRAEIVMVSLAQDGERGDLPALMKGNSDLAKTLSANLASTVQLFWEGDEESQLAIASYVIIGAATEDGQVSLYARKDLMTYAVLGGRLAEVGGDAAPVRIRAGLDFTVSGVDEPSDTDYDEGNLSDYMPTWALDRTEFDSDLRVIDDAAWRWAKDGNRLPALVAKTRPSHEDPHGHSPDVYSLGELPASANGFTVKQGDPPDLIDGEPNPEDYELVANSEDARFACYLVGGLLFHDTQTDKWYQLDGPNMYGLEQDYAWVGHVLVFDVVDMGFNQADLDQTSSIHVEVDLDTMQVEGVVPIGPYTLNGNKD